MKYLIVMFLLTACSRGPDRIGSVIIEHDWECVKSQLNPGFSSNGDFVMTSSCAVNKCFRSEIKLGRFIWNDERLSHRLVDDRECIYGY